MSATKLAQKKLAIELERMGAEDGIAGLIRMFPLAGRDFSLLCGMIQEANLSNEQRLFLLRMAVAPDERAVPTDEIDG